MAEPREYDPLLAETDVHHVFIKPRGTATCVFFFLTPLVRKRTDEAGSYRRMMVSYSFFIVFISMVMQVVLLYAVGFFVVQEKTNFERSVVQMREVNDQSCESEEALCHIVEGKYTCAPNVVQLIGNWELLDLNKDGVFTREEASEKKLVDHMNCYYGVDTRIYYKFLLQELTGSQLLQKQGWVHENLTKGTAIHRSYVDWFKADAVLCSYGADDVCGRIFEMGIFDAPLQHPGTSVAIKDTVSAAAYCRDLLREEGRCEYMLPSNYRVWRAKLSSRCGPPEVQSFSYTNPRDPADVVSLTRVNFEEQLAYESSTSWHFKAFLTVSLLSLYASIAHDLRYCIRLLMFLIYFPNRALPGEEGFEHQDGDEHTLTGISTDHRRYCYVVLVVKAVLIVGTCVAGTAFMTTGTRYIDLLFDTLSLQLILQVDYLVCETMVRAAARDELYSIKTIWVEIPPDTMPATYLKISPPIRDFCWVSLLIVASLAVWWYDYTQRLEPVREALSCACVTEGESCLEAFHYSRAWWNNYWLVELPGAYKTINNLNAGGGGPGLDKSLVPRPLTG